MKNVEKALQILLAAVLVSAQTPLVYSAAFEDAGSESARPVDASLSASMVIQPDANLNTIHLDNPNIFSMPVSAATPSRTGLLSIFSKRTPPQPAALFNPEVFRTVRTVAKSMLAHGPITVIRKGNQFALISQVHDGAGADLPAILRADIPKGPKAEAAIVTLGANYYKGMPIPQELADSIHKQAASGQAQDALAAYGQLRSFFDGVAQAANERNERINAEVQAKLANDPAYQTILGGAAALQEIPKIQRRINRKLAYIQAPRWKRLFMPNPFVPEPSQYPVKYRVISGLRQYKKTTKNVLASFAAIDKSQKNAAADKTSQLSSQSKINAPLQKQLSALAPGQRVEAIVTIAPNHFDSVVDTLKTRGIRITQEMRTIKILTVQVSRAEAEDIAALPFVVALEANQAVSAQPAASSIAAKPVGAADEVSAPNIQSDPIQNYPFVITATWNVRAQLRQAIENYCFLNGIQCNIVEQRALFNSTYQITVTAPHSKLEQFVLWLQALASQNGGQINNS